MPYRSTQSGLVTVIVMAAVLAATLPFEVAGGLAAVAALELLIVGAIAIMLWSLTISITDEAIEWWFSFGILRQRIPRADIASAGVGKTTLLNGVGIRTDGRNVLWNVRPGGTLEIVRQDGRKTRIGVNDPTAAAAALRTNAS